MTLEERHQSIVELAHSMGLVQVEWLAQHFGVTPQTIRRDVEALSAQGVVRRYRGGIAAVSGTENVEYTARQHLMSEEKARIAELCARHVPDESSLFINIGTTTEAVAEALQRHRHLRVITNNLNVANMLFRQFPVSLAGGNVRPRDGGIIGLATIDFIRQYKVDIGIIGISGIDAEGDLLDFDDMEGRVAQAIIANSRRVFLVCDHTKFGRCAPMRVANLRDIDVLFTDRPPPEDLVEVVRDSGCDVCIAPGEGAG